MSGTYEALVNNPKWGNSTVTPALVGQGGTVTIAGNTYNNISDIIANVPKNNTVILFAQENILTISDLISVQQRLQLSLLTKIHGSAIDQDYDVNGAGTTPTDYAKNLLAKNPSLAQNLVLSTPIPGVLPLTATNIFSQYLDYTQFLTKDGLPIKNRIAKLDRNYSDAYYYVEYSQYSAIEALHQTYLVNTNLYPYVNLSFVNEFRFTGISEDVQMNMNRLDTLSTTDSNNVMALKFVQLSGLNKLVIANVEGDVRIVKGAFDRYNFKNLDTIEIRNINGRVVIEDGAFGNTNLPALTTLTFNDITKGLVIQDNAFLSSVVPKLSSITIASVQNELTIGNTILPANVSGQISNFVFQNNTGRINIQDTLIKNLIKAGSMPNGYMAFDDDFNWIKDKLNNIDDAVKAGFSVLLQGNNGSIDTGGCKINAAEKTGCAIEKGTTRMLQNRGNTVIGIGFLGIALYFLYYAVRNQTA